MIPQKTCYDKFFVLLSHNLLFRKLDDHHSRYHCSALILRAEEKTQNKILPVLLPKLVNYNVLNRQDKCDGRNRHPLPYVTLSCGSNHKQQREHNRRIKNQSVEQFSSKLLANSHPHYISLVPS